MKKIAAIIIALAIIGGGYYAYETSSAGHNAAAVPVASTDDTQSAPIAQGTPGSTPASSASPASQSTGQGMDCSQYVTASQLAGALGLSSKTTLQFTSDSPATCGIDWTDPTISATSGSAVSHGVISFSTHGTNYTAVQTLDAVCSGKPSLGIGDVSCLDSGQVLFAKGSTFVGIINISFQAITTAQFTALGNIIASKL